MSWTTDTAGRWGKGSKLREGMSDGDEERV